MDRMDTEKKKLTDGEVGDGEIKVETGKKEGKNTELEAVLSWSKTYHVWACVSS